jgi:hypothetical protein
MPRSIRLLCVLSILLALLLAACSGPAATTAAPAATQPPAGPTGAPLAVQNYLEGIVTKNVEKVSSLSCKDWEASAIQELDSLQAVKAELAGVACLQSGLDGSTALVKCTGQIVITYDAEKQNLDLSLRTYRVVQSGGDWRVCGYQP